jgi:hypothetical protein
MSIVPSLVAGDVVRVQISHAHDTVVDDSFVVKGRSAYGEILISDVESAKMFTIHVFYDESIHYFDYQDGARHYAYYTQGKAINLKEKKMLRHLVFIITVTKGDNAEQWVILTRENAPR